MAKRSRPQGRAGRRRAESSAVAAVGLFLLALALRLLFWQATADSAWPYTACYKGDAPVWLAWAEALREDRRFEIGLPLRPPGAAHLMAWLWNGRASGIPALRFSWCLMGAAVAPLVWAAARRSFGLRAAWMTGLASAAATGLMILSTSLNNETPYLLLVAALLWLWQPLRRGPRPAPLLLWSSLHALACLVRVEHLLFFALVTVHLTWVWSRDLGRRRGFGHLAASLAVFALVLLPWHLEAWAAIRRFNTQPPATGEVNERALAQVETLLERGGITWSQEALEERQRLPACCRRTSGLFVAATVAVRGGREVGAEDFRLLEEAFGSRPEPLGGHPFVALYGPLNFYLANHPGATGGFTRAPLERPPPLAGGISRYPGALVQGLPPPQLTFTYPPHLEIVHHGYRLGWEWIRAHPGDFLRLALLKLRIFWQGAASGLGGWALPLGLSGVRRPVDLVVAQGAGAAVWRLGVLAAALLGAWTGRRREALVPWLAFLVSKLAVTVAFFGYARQGATVIPVVALLVALAVERFLPGGEAATPPPGRARRWLLGAAVVALLLLGLEVARRVSEPRLTLGGRPVTAVDPFPADEYAERRLEVR